MLTLLVWFCDKDNCYNSYTEYSFLYDSVDEKIHYVNADYANLLLYNTYAILLGLSNQYGIN